MIAKWHFFWLFYQYISIYYVVSSKLNVPRVLLPIFNDFSTKFTLEATDGDCYKWTTSRTDIIKLTPFNDDNLDCSSKIIVSTITKERTRNMAVVLAEDFYTNQVLRCDIIVDVIDSLDIITTTKELYVEEAPEAFEVRAYDSQGNEFTTLENVEFEWSITSLNNARGVIGLRFISFKDSPYETPPTIENFEKIDKKGHIVLLSGAKTGSAKVAVRLAHPEYKDIVGGEVHLSVIANLIITPPEAYIMIGDTVPLKIIQMNSGRMLTVDLSSTQYYLDAEHKDIASIDSVSGLVTGLREGKTKIILYDRNIDENENGKFPSCTINVVVPAYMTLSICRTETGQFCYLNIMTLLLKFTPEVGSIFHVQERSNNGSWLTGWAKEEGVASIRGILNGIDDSKLGFFASKEKITATAELVAFPHITLTPSEVILPWDPILKPKYEIEIVAQGGDGNFFWNSNNQTIGVVTQAGLVRTHFHGTFEVSAAMMRNHHNKESAVFYILPPTKLEIVEYTMEAEVGQIMYLHVALYANRSVKDTQNYAIPFTECKEMPFKVKLSNPNFVYQRTSEMDPVGTACITLGVISSTIGISKVTVTYEVDNVVLEDSVTVGTHDVLQMLHPTHSTVALAVDSSSQIIFTGGPRPYVGRPSAYKRIVTSKFKSIVTANDVTDEMDSNSENVIILSVYCAKIGTSMVTLSINNNPLLPNTKNQESHAEITVICTSPYTISLHPVIQIADTNACPMDATADRIIIPSYKTTEIDVKVRDVNNNLFLNVSTLKLYWYLNPENSADLGNLKGVFSRTVTQHHVEYTNTNYQTITPKTNSGILKLSVAIEGHSQTNHISDPSACVKRDISGCIKDEIYLYLGEDVTVLPNKIVIYNHFDNKRKISVSHGSGYFELALSTLEVAEIKYVENARELEIIPLAEGEVQVTLKDLCFPSLPVVINIFVVSIHSIKVEMSDKVEIGKCVSAIVKVFDRYDNVVSLPEYEISKIAADFEIDIAKISQDRKMESVDELHYLVTGIELGKTQLKFSLGEVSSPMIDLQVFPPLKITPRNVTVLVGSVFEYTVNGGPQPNTLEFLAVNQSVTDITNGGLVKTRSWGHTKIQAFSVGTDPLNGQQIIYTYDEVDLHVIPMKGVQIISPLFRFQVGATVPLWVAGLPDQLSPMILGSIQKPFRFYWTIDDQNVIKVNNVFKKYGDVSSFTESVPADGINNKTSLSVPKQRLTISNSGLVQSYGICGTTHVIIKAIDKYDLKQMINVVIEVKPVHYMLLNVVSNWRVNAALPLDAIPLGTEFQVQAVYYDNSGAKFTAANLKLSTRSTRQDLVHVKPGYDNSSIIVSTKKSGDTILRGYTSGIYKNSDFIKLRVNSIMAPSQDVLTIGDIICLSTPLVTLDNIPGTWSCSDDSLLKIEKDTGIGRVVSIWTGQVTVGHSLHPSAPIQLNIVSASAIIMLPDDNKVLTNSPGPDPYRIPLVITSGASNGKKNNLINNWDCHRFLPTIINQFPFTCHMDFVINTKNVPIKQIFHIRSGFDKTRGQYTCDIYVNTAGNVNTQLTLGNVSVWTVLEGVDIKSQPIEIPFIPAISVPKQVTLAESSYSGVLSIHGVAIVLKQVKVRPVDKQLLSVQPGDYSENSVLTHRINLLDYHWKLDESKNMALMVSSPSTNQRIEVLVKLDRSGNASSLTEQGIFYQSPLITIVYNYRQFIIVIISMLLLFLMTIYAYSQFVQPVIHVNTPSLANRSLSSPSPYGSSPLSRTSTSAPRVSFGNREPVYGDPNTFYSTSPDLRRTRKYM
ncbi:hypothetical protein FQR65_LT04236 [Abscondita terminalis]|nr:hypothetical protein FQR65_LT04236 [Abscondita terminalis]